MSILPAVGLEQVIVQSPAMLPERVKEKVREEGSSQDRVPPPSPRDRDDLAPLAAVDPVRPIDDTKDGSRSGVEKEDILGYPSGKGRKKHAAGGRRSGRSSGTGHRLDIEA